MTCPTCNGQGYYSHGRTYRDKCDRCNGTGEILMSDTSMTAPTTGAERIAVYRERPCDRCNGKGSLPDRYGPSDCPTCLGTGTRQDDAPDLVAIPATAVPDAELRAAVEFALLLIQSAVHGRTIIGKDWHQKARSAEERFTAWLAQQEGRDER